MSKKFIFYEKLYKEFLIEEKFPVIRNIKVSEGKFTDIRVCIEYASFYNSPPKSFGSAVAYSMRSLNDYLGEWPTVTLELIRGDEFVFGTFIESMPGHNYFK